jgi:hypothetical protein
MTRPFSESFPPKLTVFSLQAYRLPEPRRQPSETTQENSNRLPIIHVSLASDGRTLADPLDGNRSSVIGALESSAAGRSPIRCRTIRLEANLERLLAEFEAEAEQLP